MLQRLKTTNTLFWFALLILFLNISQALATERELLYHSSLSAPLQEIVTNIQNLNHPKIPYADLNPKTEYFVRIVPRQYTLTKDNQLQANAILGTKPIIFFTTPEGFYGKSLLDIYLDIGYEAEDIIRWQRDAEMVAVVFRYPESIVLSTVTDGQLPTPWNNKVYVPTWDNVFSLFHQLAQEATVEPDKKGEFAAEKTFFSTESLKQFVLNFPDAGKQRIKAIDYATLKVTGGADWVYRELLERKLSIFEHFLGNGRTLNEITTATGIKEQAGLFEFVGPNIKLRDLPEIAIVNLGKLTMEDTYFKQ